MEILRIQALRGPNIWSRKPVLESWVDLGALRDTSSDSVAGFTDRLMKWLPGLIEHRCSVGERGGFLQRLRSGTYPAHILEHVTIELQNLAGTPVGFGKARVTSDENIYRVVVRYREEQVARACLLAGRVLLLAALHDRPFDVASEATRLRELAESVCLGPSTAAIVAAAEARGIPTRRLNAGSLVLLGQGARARRIWTAETDGTSAIAESIAQDKELTKTLLRAGGVPVPAGRVVLDAAEAWSTAQELGVPVVVKPRDGNHGRGVFTQLFAQAQVETAFAIARGEGSGVIVERCAPGSEHRLLVVGERLVAAARGDAAFIVGDGQRTVRELVEAQLNSDPRRGDEANSPLSRIEFDTSTKLLLEHQACTPDSVPPEAASILIQRNGNLRVDVTDEVHPATAAHVVLAARIVGLDIAGVDVVALDIARPLEEQGGVIVEVNASPGLHAHLFPGVGRARPVGEAIVATLFPEGESGRIPVVCVTGTNGKTTVTRLVAHLLRGAGRKVGMTCSDGIWLDGRAIERGDCAGPRSARKLLLHPGVEAAVLEAGRGGILREGLGVDKCDVAIVTNLGEPDHLGRSWVETAGEMFTVKRCPVDVVLPTGAAVLNARDPMVAEMARLSDGAVIFFALSGDEPVLTAHRAEGKRAAFARDGQLVLAEGSRETLLAEVAALPMTQGGRVPFQVENALAAAAAAWALGVPIEQLRQGLVSFRGDALDDPGRFNVFDHRGAAVIVDDCHNAAGLAALVAAIDLFSQPFRSIVYSAGGGRRDADVLLQGEQLAAAFDRVIVYEDGSATDRAEGELTALFRRGLARGGRVVEVIDIRDHRLACETALRLARPGELVVLQTEDAGTEPTVALMRAFTAAG